MNILLISVDCRNTTLLLKKKKEIASVIALSSFLVPYLLWESCAPHCYCSVSQLGEIGSKSLLKSYFMWVTPTQHFSVSHSCKRLMATFTCRQYCGYWAYPSLGQSGPVYMTTCRRQYPDHTPVYVTCIYHPRLQRNLNVSFRQGVSRRPSLSDDKLCLLICPNVGASPILHCVFQGTTTFYFSHVYTCTRACPSGSRGKVYTCANIAVNTGITQLSWVTHY